MPHHDHPEYIWFMGGDINQFKDDVLIMQWGGGGGRGMTPRAHVNASNHLPSKI